jgi:arabinogalactan endo-1,4-beta-galactosidase
VLWVALGLLACGGCSASPAIGPDGTPPPADTGAGDSADTGGPDVDAGADGSPADAAPADLDGSPAGDGSDGPVFTRVALSVSPFTEVLLNAGVTVSDTDHAAATTVLDYQRLLQAHGSTEVYARINTRTTPSGMLDSTLQPGLARAQVAVQLGLPFNPELGLFGTYGDVACQPAPDFSENPDIVLPGTWDTLTVDQMVPAIRAYARETAQAIVSSGATVNIWDIGNEVDFGSAGVAPQPFMLSAGSCVGYLKPDGVDPAIGMQTVAGLLAMATADRVSWLSAHVWPAEARLLAAAAQGIRDVVPGARVATHISQSGDPDFAEAFYGAMADGGFVVDQAGFSLYPSSNASPMRMTRFKESVMRVSSRISRPVFVAELAYPSGPPPSNGTSYFVAWDNPLSSPRYALTPEGQAAFVQDLAAFGAASGVMSGIRYWAPELWVSDWSFLALFQPGAGSDGTPRPGLDAIGAGAAAPSLTALED